jgi:hypothetical protein
LIFKLLRLQFNYYTLLSPGLLDGLVGFYKFQAPIKCRGEPDNGKTAGFREISPQFKK